MGIVPSLLYKYEILEAKNDLAFRSHLKFAIPTIIYQVRKNTWKPKPLPFINSQMENMIVVEDRNKESVESRIELAYYTFRNPNKKSPSKLLDLFIFFKFFTCASCSYVTYVGKIYCENLC